MLTTLFILVRIVANPVSNVFQKQLAGRAANPAFIIGLVHGCLALMCLPAFLVPDALTISSAIWPSMIASAVLAVAGNTLLVYALKSTDLSILGPINAYKSVISLVLGIFMIGELPTAIGATGVLLIVAGSYFVVDRQVDQPRKNAFVMFFRERGVQLRFAALLLSATEAIFLKRAILLSSPLTTFVLWSILGVPLAGLAVGVLAREGLIEQIASVRRGLGKYLALAMTTGVMQLTTLLTFDRLHVGYSLALFQMSTVLSVFLGHHYFREGNIRKRLTGSLIMATGAIMIVAFGS